MVTDPHHWTYKVPGVLVLTAAFTFAVIGIYDPGNVFWVVQVLGLYLLLRFLLVVLFYPVGVSGAFAGSSDGQPLPVKRRGALPRDCPPQSTMSSSWPTSKSPKRWLLERWSG